MAHGTWHDLPAVYKVWDLGDSLEPLLNMQAEVDAYSRMLSLQGINIPKLLGQGQIHDGMHAFIATSAGGSALTANKLQDHPEMKQQAMLSLDALHWHGTLHGDVALHNFVMSDDGQAVWLVDSSDSCQGSVAELFREAKELRQMLSSL